MPEADDGKPSLFARSDDAEFTLAGDRAVIFHKGQGAALTLNAAGTVLWLAMDEPRTRAELETALRARWSRVATETAAYDVEMFLQEMLKHGVCRVA